MYEYSEGRSIREQIEHHTEEIASYFYLNAIGAKIAKCIKDRDSAQITEFFMNGNANLMVNILVTKFTELCEDIYTMIDSNILVAQTL